jgi:hypothetical protein
MPRWKINVVSMPPQLAEMEADPTMRVIKIDSSHFCMMTAVEETITALIDWERLRRAKG